MNNSKRILLSLIAVFLPFLLKAQDEVEMADTMRSNGKIYVVITVLAVVLAGILFFLISIDLRLRKLENKDRN